MTTIDPRPDEADASAPVAAQAPQDGPQAAEQAEPAEDAADTALVRSLRLESRGRKDRVRALESRIAELEQEVGDHRTYRLDHAVREANAGRPRRLADVSDLFVFSSAADLLDDNGAPDPNKIQAALDQLIDKKPHLVQRTSGWDGGLRGSTVPPPAPSLGGLIGAAARGED